MNVCRGMEVNEKVMQSTPSMNMNESMYENKLGLSDECMFERGICKLHRVCGIKVGTTNTKKWKKLKYGHGWVTTRVNMYSCPERTKLTLLSTNQPINNDLNLSPGIINMQGENESLLDRDLFKIEMNETGQAQQSDLSETFNELDH